MVRGGGRDQAAVGLEPGTLNFFELTPPAGPVSYDVLLAGGCSAPVCRSCLTAPAVLKTLFCGSRNPGFRAAHLRFRSDGGKRREAGGREPEACGGWCSSVGRARPW